MRALAGSNISKSVSALLLPAILLFGVLCQSAWAATSCVSTIGELNTQLTFAEFGTDVTIKLVQGTYVTDGSLLNFNFNNGGPSFAGNITLLGGYTTGCAARNINPTNTILKSNTPQGDDTHWIIIDFSGDLTIEGIEFRNSPSGVGLFEVSTSGQQAVTIRRDIFTGGACSGGCGLDGGLLISAKGQNRSDSINLRFSNNLVYGNMNGLVLDNEDDTGNLENALDATIIDNTIVNNGGDGIEAVMGNSPYVYNNIIRGNSGTDVSVIGSAPFGPFLVDNIIGTHSYPMPLQDQGNFNAAPQFVSVGAGDFHLQATSPAINVGTSDVPGGIASIDIVSHDRVVGSVPDLGAYESDVDDSTNNPVVINNNDTGVGSLRAAIDSANATSGLSIIRFNIGTGCGPHVITLATPLSDITPTVIINGFTQPGATPNTLDVGDDANICVILQAGNISVPTGLRLGSSANAGAALTAKGMAFSGFSYAALDLKGGKDHIVEGNHFGGIVNGVTQDPNGVDVLIGAGISGVTVGGLDASQRNIIGDAQSDGNNGITGNGIAIAGSNGPTVAANNNQIVGNYIGIGYGSGFTNRGNGNAGIYVAGDTNRIELNLIGFNGVSGVQFDTSDAHGNFVLLNSIGTDPDGAAGNGHYGVLIQNDAHDNHTESNTILNNGLAGVRVVNGQHNDILFNSIGSNGGLGIDLAGGGVTPNDNDSDPQPAGYANRGLNFPVLTGAIGGHTRGTVTGMLTTTPGDYYIQIFKSSSCDGSAYGEGSSLLAFTTVTVTFPLVQGQGTEPISVPISNAFLFSEPYITATATDSVGNTSEFSACARYIDDTIFANGFEAPLF